MKSYFLALLLTLTVMTGCSVRNSGQNATNQPTPVFIQKAQNVRKFFMISASGNVEPMHKVNLGFMVAGKISQVYVHEGDHVKVHQLIATLDPSDYKYALQIADADLKKADDAYKRLKMMYDKNSLTPSNFVKVSATREAARAQYDLRKKQLRDTRLYTPMSGIVAKRGVDPGEIVGKGMPLFSIMDTDSVKISVAVPESEIGKVKKEEFAEVKIPAVDSTFTGKVIMVGVLADPASRTYTVKIAVPNPDLILRAGMIAEAKIHTAQKINMITVPGEAIVHSPDGIPYLFVVNPTNHRVYKRRVYVGDLIDRDLQITSGIKAGELIVTGGQFRLRDGMKVKIKSSK